MPAATIIDPPMIVAAIDMLAQILRPDDVGMPSVGLGQKIGITAHGIEMGWLISGLQMARTKVARNGMLANPFVNPIDRAIGQIEDGLRAHAPNAASISRIDQRSPGINCPPLRPDAPKPIECASNRATFKPFSAQANAADRPVKPPPITATSKDEPRQSPACVVHPLAVAR